MQEQQCIWEPLGCVFLGGCHPLGLQTTGVIGVSDSMRSCASSDIATSPSGQSQGLFASPVTVILSTLYVLIFLLNLRAAAEHKADEQLLAEGGSRRGLSMKSWSFVAYFFLNAPLCWYLYMAVSTTAGMILCNCLPFVLCVQYQSCPEQEIPGNEIPGGEMPS